MDTKDNNVINDNVINDNVINNDKTKRFSGILDEKIYINPCLNEINQANENKCGIFYNKMVPIGLDKLEKYENPVYDDNYFRYDYNNLYHNLCNHDNGSCLFWESMLFDIYHKIDKTSNVNSVIMATQKNLIKQLIFPIRDKYKNNDKEITIPSCACIKITIKNKQIIDITLHYQGFPDNLKSNIYIKETDDLKKYLSFYGLYKAHNDIKQCDIYLISDGNAMHNEPLYISNFFYKPIDSSLTPLGIYQARLLGLALKQHLKDNNIYLFCSDLSRTKLTGLIVRHFITGLNPSQNHIRLDLIKISINRIIRRYKRNLFSKQNPFDFDNFDLAINTLIKSIDTTNENKIDPHDFKKYCQKIKDHYIKECIVI